MPKQINIRFSIVVLVIIAIFCSIAYYYQSEVTSRAHHHNLNEKSSIEIVSQKSADEEKGLQKIETKQKTVSGLDLPKLTEQDKNTPANDEKNRREGFLWVDKVTNKYVVTLGNVNGVFPGGYLAVYDNDIRVGQVRVLTSYDVISYVEPIAAGKAALTKDYYQVYNE